MKLKRSKYTGFDFEFIHYWIGYNNLDKKDNDML
jgi:hypothetical protein